MTSLPKHVLLGTPKEAAAYLYHIRAMRKGSDSVRTALDTGIFKQAYSWDEFTKGFRNYSPTSYGVAGAGTGALVAALNEMRKDEEDRNYWNTLTGAAVGGGVGAGGAYLSSGIPNLVTRLSGAETPAGADLDNATPPGETSTTPPGETSTAPAETSPAEQINTLPRIDPNNEGASSPGPENDVPYVPTGPGHLDNVDRTKLPPDYIDPTAPVDPGAPDVDGATPEPSKLERAVRITQETLDAAATPFLDNPLTQGIERVRGIVNEGDLGADPIDIGPLAGGAATGLTGAATIQAVQDRVRNHQLNATKSQIAKQELKQVATRLPAAIKSVETSAIEQIKFNLEGLPRATSTAAMAPPASPILNAQGHAMPLSTPPGATTGATLGDIQDWLKQIETTPKKLRAFLSGKKPMIHNGVSFTPDDFIKIYKTNIPTPLVLEVPGTGGTTITADIADLFTLKSSYSIKFKKSMANIFTGIDLKGKNADDIAAIIREAVESGRINPAQVKALTADLVKLQSSPRWSRLGKTKTLAFAIPTLIGGFYQFLNTATGEE